MQISNIIDSSFTTSSFESTMATSSLETTSAASVPMVLPPFCDFWPFSIGKYIYIPLEICCVVFFVFCACYHMIKYGQQGDKHNAVSFGFSLNYYLWAILKALFGAIAIGMMCGYHIDQQIVFGLMSYSYMLQYMSLLAIFWYRLYAQFKQIPQLALSKYTNMIIGVFFIALFVLSMMASTNFAFDVDTGLTNLAAIVGGGILAFLVYFNCAFIYKLNKCKSLIAESNQDIVAQTVKILILTFWATFGLIAATVISIVANNYEDQRHEHFIHVKQFQLLVGCLDILTNFVCVVLSNTAFESVYKCFCRPCDRLCMKCFGGNVVVQKNEVDLELDELASRTTGANADVVSQKETTDAEVETSDE